MNKSIYLVLGGALMTAVFMLRFEGIDNYLYETRDDGVITMSVGRNLVDYGFVGVSPSGPIVEASSSPVQMLVYAFTYWTTEASYQSFAYAQTLVASFVLGLSILVALETPVSAGLVTIGLFSLILSFIYPFFLWHGSGMENPITHALLVSSIAGTTRMVRTERVSLWWAIPLSLACFVRFELMITIFALLGFFAIYWRVTFRSMDAFRLLLLVGLSCLAGHSFRIYYFGSFFPNTAVAQAISPGERLAMLLSGSTSPLREGFHISWHNFRVGAWWLAFASLPFALSRNLRRDQRFLIAAVLLVVGIAVVSPVVLGPPRIDWSRTYSHVTPVAMLIPALVVSYAFTSMKPARIALAGAAVALSVTWLSLKSPYYLGWHVGDFDQTRNEFSALAMEHDIQRPLVSNPDLGIMTWHKGRNVLDLGALGSPVVAGLQGNPRIADYILDLARPDFIESHGYWTLRYCRDVFLDRRFNERYRSTISGDDPSSICSSSTPEKEIWVRRDIELGSLSDERAFLDKMQKNPGTELVSMELDRCRSVEGDCSYIMRTVFRFIPDFSEGNTFLDVVELFDDLIERDYLLGKVDAEAPRRIIGALEN